MHIVRPVNFHIKYGSTGCIPAGYSLFTKSRACIRSFQYAKWASSFQRTRHCDDETSLCLFRTQAVDVLKIINNDYFVKLRHTHTHTHQSALVTEQMKLETKTYYFASTSQKYSQFGLLMDFQLLL